MYAIILAGGSGTRLWPLSQTNTPKQFFHFGKSTSLFQKTIVRLLLTFPPEKIVILTHRDYEQIAREQAHAVHPKTTQHIVVEQDRKNTAPALMLGVRYLQDNQGALPTECFFVCSSDHYFASDKPLLQALSVAFEEAKKGMHVLFGIKPTRPETQFGYIKLASPSNLKDPLIPVEEFVEKPDFKTAQSYFTSSNYLWNSGMFCFQIGSFLEEMIRYCPAVGKSAFTDMPSISIDYALMQHTKRAKVMPLDVVWADMGSWESIYRVLEKDKRGNVLAGDVVAEGTTNSIIMGQTKPIVITGLEGMLVVETDEAIFISKKD